MQNGKGSKPRPIKNIKTFINNWDNINWSKKTNHKQLAVSQKKNK